MKELLNELLMEDKTFIHVPFGNGFFDIYKSVVVTWGMILVVTILVILLTSNLKVHNISKRQAALESVVLGLRNIMGGILGEEAAGYCDYIVTVLVFIAISNMVGLFGFTPPTMDLNVTIGLSIMSIVLVEIAGIRKRGPGGWLIRPLSLCMRLFGNILGATVIMELMKHVVPVLLPAALSIYFDLFDGAIQAYVFCFLTSLYIKEAVEE